MLFVETQGQILGGLRSKLAASRADWNILQVMDAKAALELVRQRPIGLVLASFGSDVSGCEEFFLAMKEQAPDVIRLGLLPDRNREMVINSLGFAHECLAATSLSGEAEAVIDRSLAVWERTRGNPKLAALMADLQTLPTPPALYFDIRDELGSPHGNSQSLARIIARDPAITARLLKLANSGFYASRRSISDLHDAISLLGMEMVLSVVMAAHLFDQLPLPGVNLDALWKHSIAVSSLAKEIARETGGSRSAVNTCGIAGLLHDLGQLIFLANAAETYYSMVRHAAGNERLLLQMEQEEFGVGHPELAAHILVLWGLPDDVVEAIANHHGEGDHFSESTPLPSRAVCMAEWLLLTHSLKDDPPLSEDCLIALATTAVSLDSLRQILNRLIEQGLVQRAHNPAPSLIG